MEVFLKKNLANIEGILCNEIRDLETKKVTEFYKETPFPNYKDDDDKNSILKKGDKNFLA